MVTIKNHLWLTALLLGTVAAVALITPAQAAKSKRPNILVNMKKYWQKVFPARY